MSDLPTDEELAAARAEAERILAEPTQEYTYRDPEYRGGPRRLSTEEMTAAALDLTTTRLIVAEIEARLLEARIMMYEKIEELLEHGIPVAHIAEHSGLGHRSSVYRTPEQLKRLRAERNQHG